MRTSSTNVAQERVQEPRILHPDRGRAGLGPKSKRGSSGASLIELSRWVPAPALIVTGPMRSLRQILLPLQGPYDAEAAVSISVAHTIS